MQAYISIVSRYRRSTVPNESKVLRFTILLVILLHWQLRGDAESFGTQKGCTHPIDGRKWVVGICITWMDLWSHLNIFGSRSCWIQQKADSHNRAQLKSTPEDERVTWNEVTVCISANTSYQDKIYSKFKVGT